MPRRRSAPTSMRRDSLIRKSLSVGRLTSTTVCGAPREERREPDQPGVHREVAGGHQGGGGGQRRRRTTGCSTRSSRARSGSTHVGPDRRRAPVEEHQLAGRAARGGCRCGCPSARAGPRGPPGRGPGAPRSRCRGGPSRAAGSAGSRRPGRPRRPRGGSRPAGRPARRCRRPVPAGRAPARPAPGPAGRSRGAGCPWWRRRRGRGACPRRPRAAIATQSPSSYDARRSAHSSCEPISVERGDLAAEQLRGLRVQLGADRLHEGPACRPRTPAGWRSRATCRRPGRAASTTGEPSSSATQSLDLLGHGRPRRPDPDGARAHQPRRSHSHCHSTSPCQRWCVAEVRRGRRHRVVGAT